MSQLYNNLSEILVFTTKLLQNTSRTQKRRNSFGYPYFLFVVVAAKPNKVFSDGKIRSAVCRAVIQHCCVYIC